MSFDPSLPDVPRRVAALLLLLSGLTVALPLANAQVATTNTESTVMVQIPSGAGNGPAAAPGYSPANVTVVIGVNATVTWTNDDYVDHTVTSTSIPYGGTSLISGIMEPGATFTATFSVPGTYEYYCSLHAWMTGSVIVLPASTATTTTRTTAEFPTAYLAVVLFAVIALVVVVAPRTRPNARRST